MNVHWKILRFHIAREKQKELPASGKHSGGGRTGLRTGGLVS